MNTLFRVSIFIALGLGVIWFSKRSAPSMVRAPEPLAFRGPPTRAQFERLKADRLAHEKRVKEQARAQAKAKAEIPAMQKRRKALVQDLCNKDVFTKVVWLDNDAKVFVDHGFYALDIDQKASFVSVVAACVKDSWSEKHRAEMKILGLDSPSIRVYDGHNGKKIGEFDWSGLKMN